MIVRNLMIVVVTLFLTASLTAANAVADDGDPPQRPSKKEIIEKFDTDGDGRLSQDERAAARKAFAERRGERGRRDGRVERGDGERRGGRMNRMRRGQGRERAGERPIRRPGRSFQQQRRFNTPGARRMDRFSPRGQRFQNQRRDLGRRHDSRLRDQHRRFPVDRFGREGQKLQGQGQRQRREQSQGRRLGNLQRQRPIDRRGPGLGSGRRNLREMILNRFDEDGDGRLSEQEKAELRRCFESRRSNQPGQGSIGRDGERPAPSKRARQNMRPDRDVPELPPVEDRK